MPKYDADQLTIAAVELDFQEKGEFTKGGALRARKSAANREVASEHLPQNLAKPVQVPVPDFSDPGRPKTCLEVDFPIVPINALSALEGNAGKPIYQMSKWWARRRSCVFRAMLIAAAMEAPFKKNPDGSTVLDADGIPLPDETEAAKAVWDVYYANHQAAGNFEHLRVLDCFMGGGTTLVEGSRLGFQVAGVDLNPVAWFIVKNELAGTDPAEVKTFFDQIEAEVKPLIQPFYVTDCPRGHKGRWLDTVTGEEVSIDPSSLPPEERTKYRYEGPEVIYTFWAKHGPCMKLGCGHRTPVFRSPVIAEKKLGVKFIELSCKACKVTFHAELGSARMAPGAERVILENEPPFSELSQPFAQRLNEYGQGKKADKQFRVAELSAMVDSEPGCFCPKCGQFAGQFVRDVLSMHRMAARVSDIDKKHLKIEPARNSTKPVYCYLLIHPAWLAGSPDSVEGQPLGGYADAPVDATARWYEERLKNLKLIEVRGRIRLADDTSHLGVGELAPPVEVADEEVETEGEAEASESEAAERKEYGLPRFIVLPDGQKVDTRKGTVVAKATLACQSCGNAAGIIDGLRQAGHSAPASVYALQCYCPKCDSDGHVYDGRYFDSPRDQDICRLNRATSEWEALKNTTLHGYWPVEEIPFGWQTHHWSIADHGYTHWYRFFNSRQLLVHARLLHAITAAAPNQLALQEAALGAFEQYLRNQCMYCIWDISRDCMAPFFSSNHFVPKHLVVENCVFPKLGRGNWEWCTAKVLEGLDWSVQPWEHYFATNGDAKSTKLLVGDAVKGADASLHCTSSSDLSLIASDTVDLIITDPPFGDNFIYSEMANFFHAWLRLPLSTRYTDVFASTASPFAQEAVKNVARHDRDADEFYKATLTACWSECVRVMKDGGLLAFTFHHSDPSQWIIVLESLFDGGLILEATIPIASDESKGEGAQFGSKTIEHDIIHVCRKRLSPPSRVSWAKMRQWVRSEFYRLRPLLEAYNARDLPDSDIRVILQGKALEFYSRHYGQVFTAEDETMPIGKALSGINQLLAEDESGTGLHPPGAVPPEPYQYLRLFTNRSVISRDDLHKSLLGTAVEQRDFEQRGWIEERGKSVVRVPIQDRFERARQRPRKEMKTELDQAHFLIGAAMPGSGVSLDEELAKDTWMIRRSVEAVLKWYAATAPEAEVKAAAQLAAAILRRSLEERRVRGAQQQGTLFDDFDDDDDF